ncbi:hypothetical protein OUZ56_032111 [Daphnia magna]|uniref:Uncharacterized protein n=1 Tax=Daphnia magna TaxID=35525 RepID=A0ABQ9ZW60_9CRUS|nr:hypothetical protein OUZ56_032111 [Daphnia magna]
MIKEVMKHFKLDLENDGIISIGDTLDALVVQDKDENDKITVYNIANFPEHIRFASHLLALLAFADFTKILLTNRIFKENYNRSMGKLTKLWNRYNRSILASDTVHSIFVKNYA